MTTIATAITYAKDTPKESGLYLCWLEGDDAPTVYPIVECGEYGLCTQAQYIGGKILTPISNHRFKCAYWAKLPTHLDWNPHDDHN